MTELSEERLRSLLAEACKEGHRQLGRELGIEDQQAISDIRDLRNLLNAWRHTKKAIGLTILKTTTTAILILIAAAVWFYGIDKIIDKN